jgi:hypothetical protein
MNARAWAAVLLTTLAVGTAFGFNGARVNPGSAPSSGGGVTVGEPISGGTSPCIPWTDSSGDIQCDTAQFQLDTDGNTYNTLVLEGPDATSAANMVLSRGSDTQSAALLFWTAFPGAVSGADPLYGIQHRADETLWIKRNDGVTDYAMMTFSAAGAANLTGAVQMDSTADIRGAISNGGSATCDSVGTAGAVCVNDTEGMTVSGTSTGALRVHAKTGAGDNFQILATSADSSGAWLTASTDDSNREYLRVRGSGGAFIAGYSGITDSGSTAGLRFTFGRDTGTITTPSVTAFGTAPFMSFEIPGVVTERRYASGRISAQRVVPTVLAANADNYAGCTGHAVCFLGGGAADRDITGFTKNSQAVDHAESFKLCNVGTTNNLVLKHDATSTAANRLFLSGGTDKTLVPYSCVDLLYNDDLDRWLLTGGPT